MESTGNTPRSSLIGNSAIAFVLLVALACWMLCLGVGLLTEVNARIDSRIAVLPSVGVLVTNFSASALVPVLLLCAFFLREKTPEHGDSELAGVFLNILGILIGVGIGWGLAVFLVPFDDEDGAIYSRIGTGVTTFLSGFVVSYVPRLVKTQLATRPQAFLIQIGLGIAALLITGLAVTTNRTEYLEFARLDRAELTLAQAEEKARIEAVKAEYEARYTEIRIKRRTELGQRTGKALDILSKQPSFLWGLFGSIKETSSKVGTRSEDQHPESIED